MHKTILSLGFCLGTSLSAMQAEDNFPAGSSLWDQLKVIQVLQPTQSEFNRNMLVDHLRDYVFTEKASQPSAHLRASLLIAAANQAFIAPEGSAPRVFMEFFFEELVKQGTVPGIAALRLAPLLSESVVLADVDVSFQVSSARDGGTKPLITRKVPKRDGRSTPFIKLNPMATIFLQEDRLWDTIWGKAGDVLIKDAKAFRTSLGASEQQRASMLIRAIANPGAMVWGEESFSLTSFANLLPAGHDRHLLVPLLKYFRVLPGALRADAKIVSPEEIKVVLAYLDRAYPLYDDLREEISEITLAIKKAQGRLNQGLRKRGSAALAATKAPSEEDQAARRRRLDFGAEVPKGCIWRELGTCHSLVDSTYPPGEAELNEKLNKVFLGEEELFYRSLSTELFVAASHLRFDAEPGILFSGSEFGRKLLDDAFRGCLKRAFADKDEGKPGMGAKGVRCAELLLREADLDQVEKRFPGVKIDRGQRRYLHGGQNFSHKTLTGSLFLHEDKELSAILWNGLGTKILRTLADLPPNEAELFRLKFLARAISYPRGLVRDGKAYSLVAFALEHVKYGPHLDFLLPYLRVLPALILYEPDIIPPEERLIIEGYLKRILRTHRRTPAVLAELREIRDALAEALGNTEYSDSEDGGS